jgi:hypothetical protein
MENLENLLDRIDAIRANSVTDQEFDKTWGTSLDKHLEKMMEIVSKIDAKMKNRYNELFQDA